MKATEGPEETVKSFLSAAADGDYKTAHDHFSRPLKEVQGLEAFEAAVRANESLFQVVETTFNQRSVDPNGAELSGTLTLRSGTRMAASFKLVKENDAWRLLAYQIGSQ
jgi:hypothetical protein